MDPEPNRRSITRKDGLEPGPQVEVTDLIDLDQDARVTKFITKLVVSIASILSKPLILVVEGTILSRRR